MSQIIKSTTKVYFKTDRGYESDGGSTNQDGIGALLWALDEIGRVMTIDGQEDAARDALEAAIRRTEADLNKGDDRL
ncbi:hypothetical protein G3N95_29770 [Paraburkholderia sp. Tr-20389]|uniref:hypothetical protein n=1 Tax=Paraburkholderia sp. Tr-20389 TaxID=2703903 RepID=UPI0019807D8E|nr:hypothetical protein [Paraburkholderia sp. Tr-20389]MBN3757163.1 hypothetical protein [Paraburkholderia sp. Tr-20389]